MTWIPDRTFTGPERRIVSAMRLPDDTGVMVPVSDRGQPVGPAAFPRVAVPDSGFHRAESGYQTTWRW